MLIASVLFDCSILPEINVEGHPLLFNASHILSALVIHERMSHNAHASFVKVCEKHTHVGNGPERTRLQSMAAMIVRLNLAMAMLLRLGKILHCNFTS